MRPVAVCPSTGTVKGETAPPEAAAGGRGEEQDGDGSDEQRDGFRAAVAPGLAWRVAKKGRPA
jgi:hypothetical protein